MALPGATGLSKCSTPIYPTFLLNFKQDCFSFSPWPSECHSCKTRERPQTSTFQPLLPLLLTGVKVVLSAARFPPWKELSLTWRPLKHMCHHGIRYLDSRTTPSEHQHLHTLMEEVGLVPHEWALLWCWTTG